MGCDIHLWTERRADPASPWVSCDLRHFDPDTGDLRLVSLFGDDPPHNAHDNYGWGISRCYDLFAILADVRNGVGFAGRPTGTPLRVIAAARGLPHDMSAELRVEMDRVDHTPSWLLLSEILDWPHWDDVQESSGKTYRTLCSPFWRVAIPQWQELSRKYSLIRLVFYFDS